MFLIIVIIYLYTEMRKCKLFTIALLLFCLPGLHSQIPGTDSLFSPNDLFYFSHLEQKSFAGYFEGNPDYLSLISSVNPYTKERDVEIYRDWIADLTGIIRDKRFDQWSETKKIRHIRNYINRSLLLTYDHRASFDDLFRSGVYNHYIAAAIYAFIFEQLGIPYEIYETTSNINLLIYPENRRISLETSSKGSLFFMFDHQTRESYVEYLNEIGVINDIEFNNTSNRNLFEQYYFADYKLSIRELIGLQYLNSAISYLEDQQLPEVYSQLEKAFILNPSYKSQYLLLKQLGLFLELMDYHNTDDLAYLVKASRLIGFGINPALIKYYFSDMVNTVLFEENDTRAFDIIHEYITTSISDTSLTKEFEFLTNYHYGRLYQDDARFEEALESYEDAFMIYPDNEDNQNMLVQALAGYASVVSPAIILERIEYYDTAFTEIESEDVYTIVRADTYLEIFGQCFQLSDVDNGEKYMALFERFADKYPYTINDKRQIGRSYSSASIYYYRKGMITRSKEILKKGLVYAPDNMELKLKLAAFE
jgi:tetratricopeptide (TPR) repeat protein